MDDSIGKRQLPPPYTEHGFTNPGHPDQYAASASHEYEPRTSLPPEIVYGSHPPAPGFVPPQGSYPQGQMPPPPPTINATQVTIHASLGPEPGCPVCHNNEWTGTYPCCGWFLAIFLFPIGILFCLCMRRKKCTKCGYIAYN